MSCKDINTSTVNQELYDARTESDKVAMGEYNCSQSKLTYPPGLISMMSPKDQATFKASQIVNDAFNYDLDPNKFSNPSKYNMASGNPQTSRGGCTYAPDMKTACRMKTPYPYYALANAYDPTVGDSCINYGQNLNLMYQSK